MSSIARKINKNAENFMLENLYKNMTPEQYKIALKNAIDKTTKELTTRFEVEYEKLRKSYQQELDYNAATIMNTISVELLYEIANQIEYWDMKEETEDDIYTKESAKFRIKEIYSNTMQSIKQYATMKKGEKAFKVFEKRKKQLEKEFDIKF